MIGSFATCFAYTFAPPNTVYGGGSDPFIHNIVYFNDVVPYVPQGFTRYGNTYVVGVDSSLDALVGQLYQEYANGGYTKPVNAALIGGLCWFGSGANQMASIVSEQMKPALAVNPCFTAVNRALPPSMRERTELRFALICRIRNNRGESQRKP